MGEILHAALEEMTGNPGAFAAEVVQALVLAAVLGWAVRRLATKRLAQRRARIAAALADAERAERDAGELAAEARDVVARAEEESLRIVRAASEEADAARRTASAECAAEAERLVRQAHETVEREKRTVRTEAAERLVRLTTATARRYLDDILTDAERRAVTEKAIVESLEEMDRASQSRSERK